MRHLTVTLLLLAIPFTALAHTGEFPSIHDTLATIIDRLIETQDPQTLRRLRVDDAVALLTDEEREILGTSYWHFEVDQPVTVSVLVPERQRDVPFWLEDRGFEATDIKAVADEQTFVAWRKGFEAGPIGLGFSALDGYEPHYMVVLHPQEDGGEIALKNMYPKQHTAGPFREGAFAYCDSFDQRVETVPAELEGGLLLRAKEEGSEDTQLVKVYRVTDYPASEQPEHVVLTWADDPKTTQTVQWRTSPAVVEGHVRYRAAGAEAYETISAEVAELKDRYLVNDPVNHRFTATMTGLEPGAKYEYQVGYDDTWTDWATFETAPAAPVPFRFVYMGDAQNGLDDWGALVHGCFDRFPDAKFYVMAGDLVDRGNDRDDWDSFFHNATGIYDRRQLVPAIGNHENQGSEGPWMYLANFDLPENGSAGVDAERSYSMEYGGVQLVVLDTNADVAAQAEWLDATLGASDATWKFVVYHHPAYSSAPGRNNADVQRHWVPILDKHHVDLALQGHDHAYLRTWPMFGGSRVPSPADGTIYVVSVSGIKFYDQGEFDYTEFGMTKVSTYQILDIQIEGDKLVYKAYDKDGEIRDQFVIEK